MKLTAEEHQARAMLLGMEYIPCSTMINDKFYVVYRRRIGPNRFGPGFADFEYVNAETLEVVMPARSELDMTMVEHWYSP
jgi:hypothetical protein